MERRITKITNWFQMGRVGTDGKVQSTTFRKIKRDIDITMSQLEATVGQPLNEHQFEAQRKRVELMIQLMDYSEDILVQLRKANSVHNCFGVRWRVEKIKAFLEKYIVILNNYNEKFLCKIHGAIEMKVSNGLIVDDNLIWKGENEVEIIK